jgi:hypothetical protein
MLPNNKIDAKVNIGLAFAPNVADSLLFLQEGSYDAVAQGALTSLTLDFSVSKRIVLTLGSTNLTSLQQTGLKDGEEADLVIIQAATARTVAFGNTFIKTAATAVTATNNAVDVFKVKGYNGKAVLAVVALAVV